MSNINVKKNDLGIVDGFQTFEIVNADTNEVIGYDQTVIEASE
jgi:hypothetical protein